MKLCNPIPKFKILLLRLLSMLGFYQLCRILFFIFNSESFEDVSLLTFIGGIRFDISAVFYINILFVFFSLLPFCFKRKEFYQKIETTFFVLINTIFLATNIVDFVYYKFTGIRSSFNIITAKGMENDIGRLLLPYFAEYWYLIILLTIFTLLITFTTHKINSINLKNYKPNPLVLFIWYIFIIGGWIIGVRGGFQPRPITIVNAGHHASPQNVAIVLNTPFSIFTTLKEGKFIVPKYFTDEDCKKIVTINKDYSSKGVNKKNIVILVLESFGSTYIGVENKGKGFTPFLDSLSTYSLYFNNGISNGMRSIESIPSIVASIPSLLNVAYIISKYSSKPHETLPLLLKKIGYTTRFYHGAFNGSQHFDSYSIIAGFDNYLGKSEYPHDNAYDGTWGIFDEEFLSFFCDDLSNQPQPFLGLCFTISAHAPFTLPEKYKDKFPRKSKIHSLISYTDFSLRKFFEKARKKPWYNNTLFVFTADHTSWNKNYYSTVIGKHDIPIIFFDPSNDTLAKKSKALFQQIDITPSILDYIHYPYPFKSLGKSFNEKGNIAVFKHDNVYHFMNDKYKITFDGNKINEIFEWKKDSLQRHNLISTHLDSVSDLESYSKAYLQTYYNYVCK